MPHAHQLAAVSLLKLVLALRIVSCSHAPAPQPPSPQLGDAVAYRFPAFDDRTTEHSLVVATSSSIISPAAFLFDAQFFPEFNRSEGFVLLSRTVQLWSADTGAQPTREASFNTSFTLDDASPLTFVVLLDSFPPLASRPVGLRGANSSTFSNDTTAPNASDNLAAVAVGAVSSYGPESPDVGLNVTVTPNGTEPRSRTVWIEYSAVTHHLWVYLAAAGEPRPLKALLDAPLNLAGGRTTQNAFVGFFAATVRDVIHGVRNWEFTVDKFPGSDGDGENGSMSMSSWLVILLVLLGSVAATAGIVTVVICYSLSRRREALEMEQIMKQSYPNPTRRGVRPRDHP
ncbi:uncharacterized protein LOC133889167 [Phragmites australis]|uniref:uncharacterized protein LOC133889167 n=1 Tax=Phragmites australis TaxID=29695 RepID=UPI002D7A13FA|nr:uncharacterized protein LOC133889167 [Phragmites australis]